MLGRPVTDLLGRRLTEALPQLAGTPVEKAMAEVQDARDEEAPVEADTRWQK